MEVQLALVLRVRVVGAHPLDQSENLLRVPDPGVERVQQTFRVAGAGGHVVVQLDAGREVRFERDPGESESLDQELGPMGVMTPLEPKYLK